MMGLRKGVRLIRGTRKAFSEDEEKRIAEVVRIERTRCAGVVALLL
jgi:hypothetical protein